MHGVVDTLEESCSHSKSVTMTYLVECIETNSTWHSIRTVRSVCYLERHLTFLISAWVSKLCRWGFSMKVREDHPHWLQISCFLLRAVIETVWKSEISEINFSVVKNTATKSTSIECAPIVSTESKSEAAWSTVIANFGNLKNGYWHGQFLKSTVFRYTFGNQTFGAPDRTFRFRHFFDSRISCSWSQRKSSLAKTLLWLGIPHLCIRIPSNVPPLVIIWEWRRLFDFVVHVRLARVSLFLLLLVGTGQRWLQSN